MAAVRIVDFQPELRDAACDFLAAHIQRGMAAADFSALFDRRWDERPPGLLLLDGARVVGALGLVRAQRVLGGLTRSVCNLSSFAVDPAFRSYAPALLARAVDARSVVYTNFTASAAVASLLRAFGFVAAPGRERVLLPLIGSGGSADGVTDPEAIVEHIGDDPATAKIVQDHCRSRLRWLLLEREGDRVVVALHLFKAYAVNFAYVVFCSGRDRLGRFASPIRRGCRQRWGPHLVAWPEYRFDFRGPSIPVRRPTPVLYRGEGVRAADIDELYSEIALIPILQ